MQNHRADKLHFIQRFLKIIDVFICKLRKKLANATGGVSYIETIWGRGYQLCDPVADVVIAA
jgi:two-component system cell cycle response regulator CtrA